MLKKILSLIIIVCFFLTFLGPLPKAHADSVLGLPAPGTMVNLSPAYEPVMIKGLTVHKDNPFLFDFIVDVGQDRMSGEPLKKEGEKLIKYFLASLAIPDKDVWVNLSPYEKNRMIPEILGQTDMGRDLLEQDYMLKQITASLIYPEKQLGKTFWDKVYSKAQQMYGTTKVPVNTFNKVWIMADRAEVFEHNQTAFVVDSHLKVMLEEDYLALQKHSVIANSSHSIASNIVRQIILPQLEREVNTGKNFANLRQIFNSVILSSWYKKNLKEALLNQVYADKSKVKGINLNDPTIKEEIYQQYLRAYKKGVFNYIKEDMNAAGAMVPHKYFSGGILRLGGPLQETENPAMLGAISIDGQQGRLADINAAMTIPASAAMMTRREILAAAVGLSTSNIAFAQTERIPGEKDLKHKNNFIETIKDEGNYLIYIPTKNMAPKDVIKFYEDVFNDVNKRFKRSSNPITFEAEGYVLNIGLGRYLKDKKDIAVVRTNGRYTLKPTASKAMTVQIPMTKVNSHGRYFEDIKFGHNILHFGLNTDDWDGIATLKSYDRLQDVIHPYHIIKGDFFGSIGKFIIFISDRGNKKQLKIIHPDYLYREGDPKFVPDEYLQEAASEPFNNKAGFEINEQKILASAAQGDGVLALNDGLSISLVELERILQASIEKKNKTPGRISAAMMTLHRFSRELEFNRKAILARMYIPPIAVWQEQLKKAGKNNDVLQQVTEALIEKKVIAVIIKHGRVPKNRVVPNAFLSDVGVEVLNTWERDKLRKSLEFTFSIEIDQVDTKKWKTIRDVINYVIAKVKANAAMTVAEAAWDTVNNPSVTIIKDRKYEGLSRNITFSNRSTFFMVLDEQKEGTYCNYEYRKNKISEKFIGDVLHEDPKQTLKSILVFQSQKRPAASAAMRANINGGIDLNTSNGMQWKDSKDGRGVEMDVDPTMIARIRREGIDSLSPVIFKITPVISIWPLVGLQAPDQTEHLVGV